MKSNSLLVVSLGAVLAVGGWAQMASPLRVQVPFAFSAGSTTLPAGEYRVSQQVPGVLRIVAEDGKHAILLLANSAQKNAGSSGASLIFNQYGTRYFLAEVWGGAGDNGYQLILRVTNVDASDHWDQISVY